MVHQVCEYCRSRVDCGREECKSCGAPVPQVHPAYNTYGSPHFQQDLAACQASSELDKVIDAYMHQRPFTYIR